MKLKFIIISSLKQFINKCEISKNWYYALQVAHYHAPKIKIFLAIKNGLKTKIFIIYSFFHY